MRRIIIYFAFILLTAPVFSQQVNGTIISDSANLTVVKVWGTHYERGLAYGYLCGEKIRAVYTGFYLPAFGSMDSLARDIIINGCVMKIDSVFFTEAKGVIAGMALAGVDTNGLDYIGLIVSNCLLDFFSAFNNGSKSLPGCSSLMSWGLATLGTDLNGHSVITRHLDWSNDSVLLSNQVLVVHFPVESNEQPWALIGFAGQISALSGINRYFGTFQHMMDGVGSHQVVLGTLYEPVWFSLRKALELDDSNNDGVNDAKDVHDIIAANTQGYANSYIICTLAPSTSGSNERIAEVAEVAPIVPYIVFRASDFADSIVGDNLYAANNAIKWNNLYGFCSRYNSVISALGDGDSIGSEQNWNIMRDHSVGWNTMMNIQMMQYIPEEGILKLAVQKNGIPACYNIPDTWLLTDLFSNPAGISSIPTAITLSMWPTRTNSIINVLFQAKNSGQVVLQILDISGKLLKSESKNIESAGEVRFSTSISDYMPGIYLLQIKSPDGFACGKFIITK